MSLRTRLENIPLLISFADDHPYLAKSAMHEMEQGLFNDLVTYLRHAGSFDSKTFTRDFLKPRLSRPLLKQLFVINKNKLHHFLFQFLSRLEPETKLQNGAWWGAVFCECGMRDFQKLIMYTPVRYKVTTKEPIAAFFWCPIEDSLVGLDIQAAAEKSKAMRNFVIILDRYPKLRNRLVSVRNLNPSLCDGLWPEGSLKTRPPVYRKVLDETINEMEEYMRENEGTRVQDTCYLIMCGTIFAPSVRSYLVNQKFPDKNSRPQIAVGGHPSYFFNKKDKFNQRKNLLRAFKKLEVV